MNYLFLILITCNAYCQSLGDLYEYHSSQPSDIYEHIPVLKKIAQECSSVVEIGVRSMVSTWGLLQGLSESNATNRMYLGIDISPPPKNQLELAHQLSMENGIIFSFWKANDMQIELPEVDLLFIDSLHTYCHLTYELEKFAPRTTKYIALHDTSYPWEFIDDGEYYGDYSEYPVHIDRFKRGLWPAVEDFLLTHPEWVLMERRKNCHGLTILKRA